jgi:NADH-quinone oxidoreductase subunit L
MRKMGGLRKLIPVTYWMMIIGTLALTGFPYTAGWFSKDAIIESAFASHNPLGGYGFALTVIAALMTAFYSWRLIFLTFHGKPRASADVMKHVHESPQVMLVPLYVLAVGALFAGIVFGHAFLSESGGEFWRGAVASVANVMEEIHHAPAWVVWLPTVMMAVGFLVAYWFYIRDPSAPRRLAESNDWLYRFLLNKWYFDELYDVLFVRSSFWLGRFLWKKGDGWFIDGLGPDGVSARVLDVTQRVVRLQTGYLYHYAFAMLIGVAALVTWLTFAG